MPMDYKSRVPGYRNRSSRRANQAGLWLGAILGVAAVGLSGWLFFRSGNKPADPPKVEAPKTTQFPAPPPHSPDIRQDGKQSARREADKEHGSGNKTDPEHKVDPPVAPNKYPEPRFSFYKILPEKEILIPEGEIKALKHEESLSKKRPSIQYLLQAGSFSNPQDAEKLKARLSAIKIKSRIESVKIENAPWSRVKIGPFNSLADTDRVRIYLRNHQIDSVVQKSVTGTAAAQKSGR